MPRIIVDRLFAPPAALHEDDAGGGIDGSVRSGRSGRSNRSRGGSSRRYGSNQEDLEPPLPPG